MKKTIITLLIILVTSAFSYAQSGKGMHDYTPLPFPDEEYTDDMRISRGGQLYDDWWRTKVDVDKPEEDHPLWKTQSANKRNGYSTYRCKECHGWDYKGKDGAYRNGSHYTGFKGVYAASNKMSVSELEALLRGSTNKDHDFSQYLNDGDIYDLAIFIKRGVIDMAEFVNSYGSAVGGSESRGGRFFMNNCMMECHGRTGQMINFADEKDPEFVSTIAKKNPWEFIHKMRAGQPGTRMRSGIILKWSDDDIRDVLSYARILSEEVPKPGWLSVFIGSVFGIELGIGDKSESKEKKKQHHEWVIVDEGRGFGPIIE